MSQNILDTDTFAGTPGTALNVYNSKWDNASYSADYPSLLINGSANGASYNSTFSFNGNTAATWTNDQWAQATVNSAFFNGGSGIYLRVTASGGHFAGGLAVFCNSSVSSNYYVGYSGGTVISSLPYVTGDVVNIQIVGSSITVLVNGVVVPDFNLTETIATTGVPAIGTGDNGFYFSNWSAGSVTSASTDSLEWAMSRVTQRSKSNPMVGY
jgi:hypothetical protein